MKKILRSAVIGGALMMTASAGGAADADAPLDAAQIVEAFEQTCRRGFPDLDAVERAALSNGWVSSGIRAVGGDARFQASALPRVFRKDGLTLFLATPNDIGMKHSCQVASEAGRRLDLESLAAETARRFGAGAPERSSVRGTEMAKWRDGGSLLLQASVHRRPRSASLQVRVDR
jgi:hypothetical protein